ncbi:MAG TPA: hypothetical protein VGF01_17750 [Terracidiphilus sp.]|jgi:hypothetical protein
MCDDERRRILSDIQLLLEDCVEDFYANAVRDALSGSEEDFEKFLISNELWGGSGSLADSAFCDRAGTDEENQIRRKGKKLFESLMIDLGQLQMRIGKTNMRTNMWVEAFTQWKNIGIR